MLLNWRGVVVALSLILTAAADALAEGTGTPVPIGGLRSALAEARPGDVLLLEPGDHGAPEIKPSPQRPADSAPITLQSADPAHPAVFTGMFIKGATGLIFDGLRFDYTFKPGDNGPDKQGINQPFQITGARGITIRNSVFDGDLATTGPDVDVGFPSATALIVRRCGNVLLEDNEFNLWQRGLGIDNSTDVTVRGNDLHAIRMDGMNFAAVQDVLIEGNHIHDFQRSLTSLDHPDMIQFWTAGTKVSSRNITIRGNILNSGGGGWTQTIFMRNEVVDQKKAGPEMYYKDVLIEDNVIINAHLHGITLGETDGLTIRNNTLIHNRLSDGPDNNPNLWTPQINVSGRSERVSITANITASVNGGKSRGDWQIAGNLLIQDRSPSQPGWYDDVFVAARTGDPTALSPFIYLPGGPADGGKVGATGLQADRVASFMAAQALANRADMAGTQANGITALMRVTPDATFLNRFSFDAGLSLLPETAASASYHWDFGEATADGVTASHDFTEPGRHQVTLTVTVAETGNADVAAWLDVPGAEVLRLDPDAGVLLSRKAEGMRALPGLKLVTLADGGKALPLGQGAKPIAIPPTAIAGLFGARDFDLQVRVQVIKQKGATGEILRVNQTLVLLMTPNGGAEVQFFGAGAAKPVVIRTGPLRLHDGAWHDLRIVHDAAKGRISLSVDGKERAAGRSSDPVGPMKSWGLSLGNPFGQKSLDGHIVVLQLHSNLERFAR